MEMEFDLHAKDKPAPKVGDADADTSSEKPSIFASDSFQQVMILINMAAAIYSALMAALLAIFVPQHCCPQPETIEDWGKCLNVTNREDITDKVAFICSISENFVFNENNQFSQFVVVFNFITLATIIAVFIVEYWRERFIIETFDIDSNKVDQFLKEYVFPKNKYPNLEPSLRWHNQVYYWTYLLATLLWFINAMVSAVLVFRFYFLDTRTATAFVTNNLLLFNRFLKGYGVASVSIAESRAVSFYFVKQVTFNVVDKDYKKLYQPGGAKYVGGPVTTTAPASASAAPVPPAAAAPPHSMLSAPARAPAALSVSPTAEAAEAVAAAAATAAPASAPNPPAETLRADAQLAPASLPSKPQQAAEPPPTATPAPAALVPPIAKEAAPVEAAEAAKVAPEAAAPAEAEAAPAEVEAAPTEAEAEAAPAEAEAAPAEAEAAPAEAQENAGAVQNAE